MSTFSGVIIVARSSTFSHTKKPKPHFNTSCVYEDSPDTRPILRSIIFLQKIPYVWMLTHLKKPFPVRIRQARVSSSFEP